MIKVLDLLDEAILELSELAVKENDKNKKYTMISESVKLSETRDLLRRLEYSYKRTNP